MIVTNLGGKKVEIYDSIETLPIINFQKYNKFILVDSLIGSDLADVTTAINRAIKYLGAERTDLAITQLQNVISCVSLISQEISPKYLAFAALVKSVNGKINNDLSDAGLHALMRSLTEVKTPKLKLTHNMVVTLMEKVKKKLNLNSVNTLQS